MILSHDEFVSLVEAAIARLPTTITSRIQNVAFLVADTPTAAQRSAYGLRHGETLFGVFEGLTRGEEVAASAYLPPTITLFRLAHTEPATDRAAVIREIDATLWHEIAHYLGLDEGEVRQWEQTR